MYCQGGPDRLLNARHKLVADVEGCTPLYQAAMCLMEEVSQHCQQCIVIIYKFIQSIVLHF